MKYFILLWLSVQLNFAFSQKINLKSAINTAKNIKSAVNATEDLINGMNSIGVPSGESILEFYFDKSNSDCNNNSVKTKTYHLKIKPIDKSVFCFIDNKDCVQKSNEQYLCNKENQNYKEGELWKMIFYSESIKEEITIIHDFSIDIRKDFPLLNEYYFAENFFIRSDTVFRKLYKTASEYEEDSKGVEEEPFLLIRDNKIINIPQNIFLCQFQGNNIYQIALLWLSYGFCTHEKKIPAILERTSITLKSEEGKSEELFFKTSESYCGSSQEKTKTYHLMLIGENESTFTFVDKLKCISESDEQYLSNQGGWSNKDGGGWEMLFFADERTQGLSITHKFSQEIIEHQPMLKNFNFIENFFVRNDTVFSMIFKTEEDTKEVTKDKLEPFLIIRDNVIFDLKEKKEVCKYRGDKVYEIALLWFSLRFLTQEMVMAKELIKFNNIKYNENQEKLKTEFLQKTKKCYYCNESYTGESFDYPYSSTSDCDKKIYVVYKARFCSRKCALQNCQYH